MEMSSKGDPSSPMDCEWALCLQDAEAHVICWLYPQNARHPGPKNVYRTLLPNYHWSKIKDDCRQFGDF